MNDFYFFFFLMKFMDLASGFPPTPYKDFQFATGYVHIFTEAYSDYYSGDLSYQLFGLLL